MEWNDQDKVCVDNFSSVNIPTKTVLRETKSGRILANLTEANIDVLNESGWQSPETFEFIGKDGMTTLFGALWKPTNFDSSKKYPIMDHSYTGPHTQVFPRSFSRVFKIKH